MKITSASFSKLPFTKLFQDYISDYNSLAHFFETDPFSVDDIEARIKSFSFKGDREHSVNFLKEYNKLFDAGERVYQSIDKLENDQSLAIVTGQQLTLFGGPLFTIYKILTAIVYSKKWEKKYNRPFIPVFWMADEDHDYEEAATIGIPVKDEFEKLFYQSEDSHKKRVFDTKLGKDIHSLVEKVKELQFDTDFSDQLWNDIHTFYTEETTFGDAFGKWILHLFGKHGLILIGSNHDTAKQLTKKSLQKSVQNADANFSVLSQISDNLVDAGYHKQVHLQPSNLFWVDDDGNRTKINHSDNTWFIDENEIDWSTESLVQQIESHPEKYSPNVFLRPVIQSYLVPAIAYVAGPGEIAYYAQIKGFYRQFGLEMPVIIPRFSATIIESGIDRIINKLPFEIPDYNQRIEDLESSFINQADTPDIEKIFGQWRHQVTEISKPRIDEISEIDPTLKGSSEKAKSAFFTELDKLKGKVFRSVKDQEKTNLVRIRKIQSNLFPNSNLQEREVAFIYFMNKYGIDIWDQFLEAFEDEEPGNHKLIHL